MALSLAQVASIIAAIILVVLAVTEKLNIWVALMLGCVVLVLMLLLFT